MSLTVGVDVGGTKIAAGVVDDGGAVVEKLRVDSPADDPVALRKAVQAAVEALRGRHEFDAVGVGAAGFVRADRRGLHFAPHLQWGSEAFADLLQDDLGLPVVVENDGNAAAWAEFRFGASQGVDDQLMVALGTGIGGGMILSGEIYRGGHGIAGEIGHIGVVRDGIPCECGRKGCLEEYASGNALQRDARVAALAGRAPRLLELAGGDAGKVTGVMVSQMAAEGAEEALELFRQLGGYLGTGIASLVAVLDPAVIVLGGGVSEAGDILLEPVAHSLRLDITGGEHRPGPELRIAALGNDAGLIGAADLARHRPR